MGDAICESRNPLTLSRKKKQTGCRIHANERKCLKTRKNRNAGKAKAEQERRRGRHAEQRRRLEEDAEVRNGNLVEQGQNTRQETVCSRYPRRHLLCWGLAGPDEAEGEDGRRRRRRPAGTPTSPNTRVGAKRRREENTSALHGYPTHTLYFTVALNPGCQSGAPWHPHMSLQNRNRQPTTQQSSPPRKKFTDSNEQEFYVT